MNYKKYIEDLKNDNAIYQLKDRITHTSRLSALLGQNQKGLCIDELISHGVHSQRELGIEKGFIADETDDDFGIQKAVAKLQTKEKKNKTPLEKLYFGYSRMYLSYLYLRRSLGYPKDDIDVGKLMGLEYPIQMGIGILNPGGFVYVPAATYSITTAITPVSDMLMAGAGTATLLDADADVTVIKGDTANYDDITIRDLKILGYGSGTGYGILLGDLGVTYATNYLHLSNLRISNTGYSGVRLRTTNPDDNINLVEHVSCRTVQSANIDTGSGFRLKTCDHVLMQGCEARANNGCGMYLAESNNYCWLISNKLMSNVMHGIELQGSMNFIIANWFQNNDSGTTQTYDGLHLYNSDYCVLNGNWFRYNDRYQIHFDNFSDVNVCLGNFICTQGTEGSIVESANSGAGHGAGYENEIAHNRITTLT